MTYIPKDWTDYADLVDAASLDHIEQGIADTSSTLDALDGVVIKKTLIDAKGDLIAGTAADAVARVPVGANGQALLADSTYPSGLRWGTPPGGGGGGGVPWINVKDYGATGDGVTDDTAEITSALAAADATGGNTVYFPPGTYIVEASSPGITIPDNTRLTGEGNASVIKYKNGSTSTRMFFVYGGQHITIDNLSFDLNHAPYFRAAITLGGNSVVGPFKHIRVMDCTCTDSDPTGDYTSYRGFVGMVPMSDGVQAEDVWIVNNYYQYCQIAGNASIKGLHIIGNHVDTGSSNPISVNADEIPQPPYGVPFEDVFIIGNLVTGAVPGAGIYLGSDNTSLANRNTFKNFVVSQNVLAYSPGVGWPMFAVRFTADMHDFTITDNILINTGSPILSGTQGMTCSDTGGFGYVAENFLIANNYAEGADTELFKILSVDGLRFIGNKAKATTKGRGIQFSGIVGGLIKGNISEGSLLEGNFRFTGDNIDLLVEGNIAKNGGSASFANIDGFYIAPGANRTAKMRFHNNRAYDDRAPRYQRYGINEVAGGIFDTAYCDNWLRNNLTAGMGTINAAAYRRGNKIANSTFGETTLVAGTATVATGAILTGDTVAVVRRLAGGTIGTYSVGSIVNAVSFVITSTSGTDTSTVYWEIIRPAGAATSGQAVLVNGTVTVPTTEVRTGDSIILSRVVAPAGLAKGTLAVGTITNATSFVINSLNAAGAVEAADTSTIFWEIVH